MSSRRRAATAGSRCRCGRLDALRVDARVAAQDVLAHALAHGDDRVRRLEGGALDERRDAVAAAELLGLPRPHRLQAVGGHDVRACRRAGRRRGRRSSRTRCASGRGRRPRSRRPCAGRRPWSAPRRSRRPGPAGRRSRSAGSSTRLAERADPRIDVTSVAQRARPARRRAPPRRRRSLGGYSLLRMSTLTLATVARELRVAARARIP